MAARTVYYAAMSLDGFIAEPEEKLEWLTGFDGPGYAGAGGGTGSSPMEKSYPAFMEGVGALVRPLGARGEREEGMPADLDRHVGAGEEQRPLPPRVRDRDRHQQAAEHHPDHQSAHGRALVSSSFVAQVV